MVCVLDFFKTMKIFENLEPKIARIDTFRVLLPFIFRLSSTFCSTIYRYLANKIPILGGGFKFVTSTWVFV